MDKWTRLPNQAKGVHLLNSNLISSNETHFYFKFCFLSSWSLFFFFRKADSNNTIQFHKLSVRWNYCDLVRSFLGTISTVLCSWICRFCGHPCQAISTDKTWKWKVQFTLSTRLQCLQNQLRVNWRLWFEFTCWEYGSFKTRKQHLQKVKQL